MEINITKMEMFPEITTYRFLYNNEKHVCPCPSACSEQVLSVLTECFYWYHSENFLVKTSVISGPFEALSLGPAGGWFVYKW